MATLTRKMLWLTVVMGVLASSSACVAFPRPQPTVSLPTTQIPFALTPQPCASGEFALPQNVLEAGRELWREDNLYRTLELGPQQYGWLSVHLDLIREVVRYGEAIPLRLTITNETDHPVIFLRPQYAQFLYYYSFPPFHPRFIPPTPHPLINPDLFRATYPYLPIQLYVELAPFPDEIRPPKGCEYERMPFLFSMLPPGQSCTVEWELAWNETVPPLAKPIPPGNYTLKVFLRGTALGPELWDRRITIIDIGGWVGTSEASNSVTLTIVPPE